MSQRTSRMWIGKSAVVGMFTAVAVVVGFAGIGAGVAYAQVPTLSQTSITVGAGQSLSVTSENNVAAYVGSNTASNIVSATVNGTQITVKGIAPGTATLSICGVGTASDCTNLYITVQATPVTGIAFSPNSLSLSINGNQSVAVSGGNGSYSVSSNSNTSVASTGLSGSTLTVTGIATGSATITVCDSANNCGTLSVTVSSSGSTSSGLTFSTNNISLTTGANQTVTVSGGDGSYSITNNSNASVASTGITGGNGIVVDALTAGSATITVCDASTINICGTLSVTVTGASASSNGAVTFSTASPTVAAGQTLNVTLSGGATTYVVLSNQTATVASASVTGNSNLAITGETAGTDVLTICAIAGGCTPYTVTVTGASTATTAPTTTTAPTVTSTATPTVTTTVTPTTVPAAGTVVNSTLLAEIQALQTAVTQTLSQIESIQSQLSQVEAQVNAGSGGTTNVSVGGVSAASAGTSYSFTELLTLGSEDAQVTALQQRLAALGFYSGPVTGYYGSLTEQAVVKYQTSHGITATGSVGPETRAALNAGN